MNSIRLTSAVCGLAASSTCFAQAITSAPAILQQVPLDHPLFLALLAALICLAAFAAMRKYRLPSALLFVILASLLLWQSPKLRAQILGAFSNPAGETLPIPVQQIPSGIAIAGFEAADFRNDSGVPLVIRTIDLPTPTQCFPSGSPNGGVLAPTPVLNPPAACAVGAVLAPGATCRVDVDTHCRDVSPFKCYDHTVYPLFDVQYTGVPNVTNNLLRFFSNDGTCNSPIGTNPQYYVIEANSLAEADALCPLQYVYTMTSFGFTTARANLYICTTSTAP